MSQALDGYHRKREKCLANANRCFGDSAAIWRELASSYSLLITLEEREARENSERVSWSPLEPKGPVTDRVLACFDP